MNILDFNVLTTEDGAPKPWSFSPVTLYIHLTSQCYPKQSVFNIPYSCLSQHGSRPTTIQDYRFLYLVFSILESRQHDHWLSNGRAQSTYTVYSYLNFIMNRVCIWCCSQINCKIFWNDLSPTVIYAYIINIWFVWCSCNKFCLL
jgi:hypothetical protein